jgi:glutamate-1-semialdehyde 2,1-aminomutase
MQSKSSAKAAMRSDVSSSERAAPSAKELFAIAERDFPGGGLGGYALPEAVRFLPARARGSKIEDVEGRSYIDFVGGAGALILGHAHPAVTAAITEQAALGTHFFGTLNKPALQLAELMRAALPHAEKIAFTTSGSESTFYTLRMCRAFTGRDKVLKFDGAYHGNHDYSVVSFASKSIANYPVGRADTGGLPSVLPPTVLVAPYNDLIAAKKIVEQNRHELAAIIVEPIQRVVPPLPDFLPGLRKIADEFDVPLVFDEVVTGFRLALGGAQEYFGVKADLAAYGKVLGAGIAIGAVAGRADIIGLAAPSNRDNANFAYVNGTFHGNPLGAAAGVAMLTELARRDFYKDLHERSQQLRSESQKILDRHGIDGIVAGEGSLWQILFRKTQPRNYADLLSSNMDRVKKWDSFALKSGIYVLPGVRRFVSAAITEEDVEKFCEVLDATCRSE